MRMLFTKMVPGEVSLALLYSGKHLLGHSDLIFHDHCKRKHLIGSKILILRSGPSFRNALLCILLSFCLCPAITTAQETDNGEASFSSVLTIDISRIARRRNMGSAFLKNSKTRRAN